MQDTATENVANDIEVQPEMVDQEVSTDNEGTDSSQEDTEPDESEYADPAEYRKALKEFGRKEAEKQLRTDYDRKINGLANDLRKQRAAKREMRMAMEEMESRITSNLNKPVTMEEPRPELFNSPQEYAKAYGAWNEMAQKASQPNVDPVAKDLESALPTWQTRLSSQLQYDPDLKRAVEITQREGVGQHIRPQAATEIMKSHYGTEIYKYLAYNPEMTEEIEDLNADKQVQAIRAIEQYIIRNSMGIAQAKTQQIPQQNAPVAPVVVSKPIAPPPAKVASAPAIGAKPLTKAKDMNEFMRLRMQQQKKR